MTGSRVNLVSIGRLARVGECKRRRLDAEEPMTVPDEVADDGQEEDDDAEDGGRQPVGPFGTYHDHGGDHRGTPPSAAAAAGTTSRVPLWWPSTGAGPRTAASTSAPWPPPSASSSRPGGVAPPGGAVPTGRAARVSVSVSRARRANAGRGQESDGGYSSQDETPNQREQDWSQLPAELLVGVLKHVGLQDLGRCAQVCRGWRRTSQEPCLWRTVEFVLGSSLRPEPTPPALIDFILEEHAQHLKSVVLRTDSSSESARAACRILSRLVKCSLKTLALMSGAARPSLLDVDGRQFASALTLVLDHSSLSLRALAVDHTLVDDPSLQALAGIGSDAGAGASTSLQLLRCKSCPRLSPGGVLALVDRCRCLRELSLSYTLLSDDLLTALSSERHVSLEVLRVDVYTDPDNALRPISPTAWRSLVAHSPQLNLVMYLFDLQDDSFDSLFTSYIPVTHLYFGDYVPQAVLSRVGAHCPRLVELVVGANGSSVLDSQLLDIASSCPQLTSLGLAECHVTCSGLVHLAEVCGPRLSQLVVMEECLVEDAANDLASTCSRLSQILGRDWSPEFVPMW